MADPDDSHLAIPEFDIRGLQTSQTPVLLFFAPPSNPLGAADDMKRLKRYYPRNITVRLKRSARLPFMEEPDKFGEALTMFIDLYLR